MFCPKLSMALQTRAKKILNVNNNIEDSKKAATYSSTSVVPSALMGLTSLFGMVRGEPHCYNHLKSFSVQYAVYGMQYELLLETVDCQLYIVDILKKSTSRAIEHKICNRCTFLKKQPYNKPMGY